MKINKKLIAHNFNKGGNTKEYIVIHDTGNKRKGANAESHYRYFNGGNRGASAHYFVDDTQIVQCVEDNDRSWHAGKKYGTAVRSEVNNSNSIGIEICVNSDGDYEKAFMNAVELTVHLIKAHNISIDDVVTHYEACVKICPASMAGDSWRRWDIFKLEVSKRLATDVKVAEFKGLSSSDSAARILDLVRKNALSTGIFPSVKAAQMILESGFLKSELAQEANNCFGMKTMLSGNTWKDSAWDGVSVYSKETQEQEKDGTPYIVVADFRKYASIEDSIADHSAYLLGAKMGSGLLRYAGLSEASDYREQITIIKEGGYATDVSYVSKVCSIIRQHGLDKYDDELSALKGHAAVAITVDKAISDGVLSDRQHWIGVLDGTVRAVPKYIKIVLDRYHDKLNSGI